jgi:8-oxo-dGTP pyrophosphatase MutT (NUDIX family)
MNTTLFQYCQKIVLFSADFSSVLLARRKGEVDYDGVYSFIGGKMETSDASFLEGLRREKQEEIGSACSVRVYPTYTTHRLFQKADGTSMVLPHVFAVFESGEIVLNDEYSDFVWVSISDIDVFSPKIDTVSHIVHSFVKNKDMFLSTESSII